MPLVPAQPLAAMTTTTVDTCSNCRGGHLIRLPIGVASAVSATTLLSPTLADSHCYLRFQVTGRRAATWTLIAPCADRKQESVVIFLRLPDVSCRSDGNWNLATSRLATVLFLPNVCRDFGAQWPSLLLSRVATATATATTTTERQ